MNNSYTSTIRIAAYIFATSLSLFADQSTQKHSIDNFSFIDGRTLLCKKGSIRIEHPQEKDHLSVLKIESKKSAQVSKAVTPGSINSKRDTGIQISAKSPLSNLAVVSLSGKDSTGKAFRYVYKLTLGDKWADLFINFDEFKNEDEESISKPNIDKISSIGFVFYKNPTEDEDNITAYIDSLSVGS